MGFRFRKTFKLAKGLRLNLSKSGLSLSVGRPGAGVSVGSRGASVTAGVPGTGVSYRAALSGTRSRRAGSSGSTPSTQPGAAAGCLGSATGLFGLILLLADSSTFGAVLLGCAAVFFFLHIRAQKEAAAIRAAERERQREEEALRQADLVSRFGDETASRILASELWVGQTEEQLREALGEPIDVDEKVMKTKKREVWKYDQVGGNRFNTRVTLENGVVTGWDRK